MMYAAYQESKDVIYSDFWQTDSTGQKISIHQCDDYDPKLITGGKRTVKGQVREGMMHSVTALTPKWVWEKIGGYDEELPAWEDWDFQISIGAIGVCSRRVAMPLFLYRKHTGFRREENYEEFQRSKEAILRKWGSLWEGGKELMACGSCSRGRTVTPPGVMLNAMAPKIAPNADAVLIRYTGPRLGSTPIRGISKTMYYFAYGDEKYVLAQDVPLFLGMAGFAEVKQEVPQEVPATPVLMASGPPS
jgi:hypothetical protein